MDNTNILSINKLSLNNFRNYKKLEIDFPKKPVVITGVNGSGKTNILEALSLFSPGKGIRGTKIGALDNLDNNQAWNVRGELSTVWGMQNISTFKSLNSSRRSIKIDDQIAKNQGSLTEIFNVTWLTPQMDLLFISSRTVRRKYLDRLVYNFDPAHASRVLKYENLTKQRMKILKDRGDNLWLSSIEHKMSELAISISCARVQTIDYLQKAINNRSSSFPKARLVIKGDLESKMNNTPSILVEEEFKEKIARFRRLDLESNRANFGIHLSDLEVYHDQKNIEAHLCSTGEQKLMLITILLAEAKLRINIHNSVPVLLLDEVCAHLDKFKREALFEEILDLKAQAFITGTDRQTFSYLIKHAEFIQTKNLN